MLKQDPDLLGLDVCQLKKWSGCHINGALYLTGAEFRGDGRRCNKTGHWLLSVAAAIGLRRPPACWLTMDIITSQMCSVP